MTPAQLAERVAHHRDAIAVLTASPEYAQTFLDQPRTMRDAVRPVKHAVHYKLLEAQLKLAAVVNELTYE